MITQRDEASRNDGARLTLALLASALLNLLLIPLALWLFGGRPYVFVPAMQREQFVVSSSSIRIEKKTVPQPKTQSHTLPVPNEQHRAQPARHSAAQPHELSHAVAQAPPQPPRAEHRTTLAETLAQQERNFAHEAQSIHANNHPFSIATIDPNQHSASQHPFQMNVPGSLHASHGEGFLHPLKSWKDRGLNCYYGRYTWYYPGGGSEDADIPWAFCYAPQRDPIAAGKQQFPFPLPLPGYRLPAGTVLQPIEKETYDQWLAQQ